MVNLSNLRFDDRAPVYQQIAEYLKRQILLGTVQDGDPMPSRRELAAQTGINPVSYTHLIKREQFCRQRFELVEYRINLSLIHI